MAKLQVLVNDLMHLICGIRRSDKISINDLVQSTNLPTVNQLAAETCAMEMWRTQTFLLPAKRHFLEATRSYDTRPSSQVSFLMPVMANNHEEWFTFKATKIWNRLPEDVRNIKSPFAAKKAVQFNCRNYNYHR